MVTVLVTGVGGTAGTATVRSLLERTSHEIVGVDMDRDATGFFFLDEYRTVPAVRASDWHESMVEVIDDYEIDVVVPLIDEELSSVPELEACVPDEVSFVLPRHDVVLRTLDKLRLSEYLYDSDCTVPETVLATEYDESSLEYPFIVKPRFGRGSRGVMLVESRADLDRYLTNTDRDPTELLFQEYIEGTEFTTSVVTTQQNELLSIVPKEVIDKEMNTIRGVTRDNRTIVTSCRRLFDEFRPHGPMNVQQIVDENETAYTIEINPRFSSTACLTVAAGVNELDLLVRDAAGESIDGPVTFDSDIHLVRYTDHMFLNEREISTD